MIYEVYKKSVIDQLYEDSKKISRKTKKEHDQEMKIERLSHEIDMLKIRLDFVERKLEDKDDG